MGWGRCGIPGRRVLQIEPAPGGNPRAGECGNGLPVCGFIHGNGANVMNLLPKEMIIIHPTKNREDTHVSALLYHIDGRCYWSIYNLSDLPNDLISLDDIERFNLAIDRVKVPPV